MDDFLMKISCTSSQKYTYNWYYVYKISWKQIFIGEKLVRRQNVSKLKIWNKINKSVHRNFISDIEKFHLYF